MIPYSAEHNPPAPVLTIVLTNIVRGRPRVEVPALLDTGSDMTAIPSTLVDRLKLYPFNRIQIEGFGSEPITALTYAARILIEGFERQEVEVVLTDLPFAILGRDVLNQFYLYLDGPSQQFEIGSTPVHR